MICPDCGNEFDPYLDASEFDSLCGDPTFSYSDLPHKMCFSCARIYHDAMFENAEDYDEYESIY